MMITRPFSEVGRSFRSPHALRRLILILTLALGVVAGSGAETPVTLNASAEAQSLMAYLSDVYGRKILSGQQEGWRGTNVLGFELMHLTNTTGKLPALLGLDFIASTVTAPTRDSGHL